MKLSIENISDLNKQAITCMMRQDSRWDALVLFQRALLLLKSSASLSVNLMNKGKWKTSYKIRAGLVGEVDRKDRQLDDCVFGFCGLAFDFSWDGHFTENSCLTQDDLNIMLGVLLFNLSSAHHYMGLRSGRSSDLCNALNFYQLALLTLENVTEDKCLENAAMILLMCSIYNNMGHIHSYFRNLAETKSCLECLKSLLLSEESLAYELYEKQYIFFMQYLLINPEEQFCLAPAA